MIWRHKTTLATLLWLHGATAAYGQAPADSPPADSPPAGDAEAKARIKALARKVEAQDRRLELLSKQQQKRFERLESKQRQRIEQLGRQNQQLQQQLEEMELRQAEAGENKRKKLQLYGWMDVGFERVFGVDEETNNFHGWLGGDGGLFSIGNLNLVVDAQPLSQWRTMIETRFTYSPDGDEEYEVPGLVPFSRTNTSGGILFEYKWGGVAIERAWVEWSPRDYFQIRAGQFFTPAGIWNLDHGTPVLVAVWPPLQLSAQVFPTRQTGLKIGGTLFRAAERLEYSLTLSNGRVPVSNTDLDANKGLGGRLVLASSRLGEIRLGVSWYLGQFTDTKKTIDTAQAVEPPVLPRLEEQITAQLHETVFGVDLQLDYQSFGLRSEMVYSVVEYDDDHRTSEPLSATFAFGYGTSGLPLADYSLLAVYGLIFYQLPWIDLRPYFSFEGFSLNDNITWDNGYSISTGINYRVVPRIVLKAEFNYVGFPNDPDYTVNEEYLQRINRAYSTIRFQAAVSF